MKTTTDLLSKYSVLLKTSYCTAVLLLAAASAQAASVVAVDKLNAAIGYATKPSQRGKPIAVTYKELKPLAVSNCISHGGNSRSIVTKNYNPSVSWIAIAKDASDPKNYNKVAVATGSTRESASNRALMSAKKKGARNPDVVRVWKDK